MNKAEILEQSRNENTDEGTEYALNIGRRIGEIGMSVMFLVLAIINFWKGINNYALFAVFWTYVGLESIGRYTITKGKVLLASSICGVLAGVLYLGCYIVYVTG